MTRTRSGRQPRPSARRTNWYWRSVDSRFSATCRGVDWRTSTMASRSQCEGLILLPAASDSGGEGSPLFLAAFIDFLLRRTREESLRDELAEQVEHLTPLGFGEECPQPVQRDRSVEGMGGQ